MMMMIVGMELHVVELLNCKDYTQRSDGRSHFCVYIGMHNRGCLQIMWKGHRKCRPADYDRAQNPAGAEPSQLEEA